MGRRSAIAVDNRARCQSPRTNRCSPDLPHYDDRSVVFADSGVFSRVGCSHREIAEISPKSALSILLAPIAGQSAEQVSEALINKFGSIFRIVSATEPMLAESSPEAANVGKFIVAARQLIGAAFRETVVRGPVDPSSREFRDYLLLKFLGRPVEELHVIYVDGNNGFIAEEQVSVGSEASVSFRASVVLRRSLELDAKGLLLVHNHPSENPYPSVEDIRATKHISQLANSLEISILDHFIVAGNNVVGMIELGIAL